MPPKNAPPATDRLRKRPQRVTRWICLDPESAGKLEEMKERLGSLSVRLKNEPHLQDEHDMLKMEVGLLRDEVMENSVKFVAISIGGKAWNELVEKWPPTKDQKREAQKQGVSASWDVDNFPRQSLKACLRIAEEDEDGKEVLTELSDVELDEIVDGDAWNATEAGSLFGAVLTANTKVQNIIDLGNV